MKTIRYNPEGHEDFLNYVKRVYGKDSSELTDEEFERVESEWLCKID